MKDGYKDFKGRNADEIEAYWRKRIPELEADGTPWAHGRYVEFMVGLGKTVFNEEGEMKAGFEQARYMHVFILDAEIGFFSFDIGEPPFTSYEDNKKPIVFLFDDHTIGLFSEAGVKAFNKMQEDLRTLGDAVTFHQVEPAAQAPNEKKE